MSFLEDIKNRRDAVRNNIAKGFGAEFIGEQLIEKGKWNVGDEKTAPDGFTYYVGGFNSKGIPLWRKKKDNKGNAANEEVSNTASSKGNFKLEKINYPKATEKPKALYSHNINGVTINVSKNADGSYTLEANGQKVKTDDPSYFKDNLKPSVKSALIKEIQTNTTPSNKENGFTLDKQRYDNQLKMAKNVIKHDGDTSNVMVGLNATRDGIKDRQAKLDDLQKNRPGAKVAIKKLTDELNTLKTNEKALSDAISDFEKK